MKSSLLLFFFFLLICPPPSALWCCDPRWGGFHPTIALYSVAFCCLGGRKKAARIHFFYGLVSCFLQHSSVQWNHLYNFCPENVPNAMDRCQSRSYKETSHPGFSPEKAKISLSQDYLHFFCTVGAFRQCGSFFFAGLGGLRMAFQWGMSIAISP